jgi:hypothetical protein
LSTTDDGSTVLFYGMWLITGFMSYRSLTTPYS